MSALILNTTDATFEQDVLQSEPPVLLDFWAPWCAPCKALNPMLERLAGQYAGSIRIVKLNIDENPGTARRFGIRSIPRLMLFGQGELRMPHVAHSQAGLKVLFDDLTKAVPAAAAPAAAAVPSFGGDPALKADYLRRLRAAVFDTDNLPADSAATRAGAFAGTTGGPHTLGSLLNGLWWVVREPEDGAPAHDWVVDFVEGIPVGIDLARVSLVLADWLLHDPGIGSARNAPTEAARALCERLAAFHRRELDGEPATEQEWSVLLRDVVALAPPPFDPDAGGELPDWSPEQGFLVNFERTTMALAECDISALFFASYSRALTAEMARLGCWGGEDQKQMQSVYEATWKGLSSTLGERPADGDAEALARWEARRQALREQVRPTVRKTHPALQARLEAWEAVQQANGSRLANLVGARFKALCAAAPVMAAAD